jgi:integrase
MAQGKRRVNPIDYFPAQARRDGRYAKRINGKVHYFGGPGIDRAAAMLQYQRVRHQLYSGQAVEVAASDYGGWTLRNAVNKYLNARRLEVEAGAIRRVTYIDIRACLVLFIRHVGTARLFGELGPDVFTAAARHFKKKCSHCRWNHIVSAVTAWLNYAEAHDWITTRPKCGPLWVKSASSKLNRRDRIVSADEFRALLAAADDQWRAMLLLALNCGLGPTDLSALKLAEISDGILANRRSKTGISRRSPLWLETVEAIDDYLTIRTDKLPCLFVTKYGRAWDGTDVGHEFADLRKRAGVDLGKHGGIYALRHTFSTLADAACDANAKRVVMGHALEGMDRVYVAGVSDERLRKVVDMVRRHFIPLPRPGT